VRAGIVGLVTVVPTGDLRPRRRVPRGCRLAASVPRIIGPLAAARVARRRGWTGGSPATAGIAGRPLGSTGRLLRGSSATHIDDLFARSAAITARRRPRILGAGGKGRERDSSDQPTGPTSAARRAGGSAARCCCGWIHHFLPSSRRGQRCR
jgi:hypothetical protein